ncbi:MAG: ketoacyl-ACP synthase III [Bacteroidales bacterium]
MKAFLTYSAYYLPEGHLTNEMINKDHPEWSVDKIASKTGIYSRSIAEENQFSSDLGVFAAQKLFAENNINPIDIDYILFCTQSPDYLLPTTACIIQDKLGIDKSTGALDFNLGCSGYVYGLGLAKALIVSAQAKKVLLITAETYSKFIHKLDRGNKTLFGDGASASLISVTSDSHLSATIGNFVFHTDGSGFDKLIVKNGGMKRRSLIGTDILDEEGQFLRNDNNLYMDGKSIFEFTSFVVPPLIDKSLTQSGLVTNDIDLFIFHQANEFMLQTVRKRCKIPEEKFFIFIKNCGNTVSSTIPIALKEAQNQGRVTKGSRVLIAGFGVGLSAGISILEF